MIVKFMKWVNGIIDPEPQCKGVKDCSMCNNTGTLIEWTPTDIECTQCGGGRCESCHYTGVVILNYINPCDYCDRLLEYQRRKLS